MTTLLAQVEPSPAAIASWLQVMMYFVGIVGGILGIFVAVKMLKDKTPETPQPLIVSAHQSAATEQQMKEVHGRIARERGELNAAIEERRHESNALRQRLDNEIKDLRQLMDDIPERTIDLLRKTKGLI